MELLIEEVNKPKQDQPAKNDDLDGKKDDTTSTIDQDRIPLIRVRVLFIFELCCILPLTDSIWALQIETYLYWPIDKIHPLHLNWRSVFQGRAVAASGGW